MPNIKPYKQEKNNPTTLISECNLEEKKCTLPHAV